MTAWLAPTPAPGEGEGDEYISDEYISDEYISDEYISDEYIGRVFSEVGTFEESGVPSLEGEGVPAVKPLAGKPLAVQPDEALPSLTAFSPPGPVRPRSSRTRSSEDAPPEDAPPEPLQPSAPVILQPAKAMSTSAMSTSKSPATKVQRIQPPAESSSPTPVPQAGKGIIQQEPAETKAEQEGPAPAEDRIWKRLQTIFRKHEEKRREGDGGISPVPEQPPDSRPEGAMMSTSEQVVSSSGPEEVAASGIAAGEIVANEIAANNIASQKPLAMTTTPPEAEIAAKEITASEIAASDVASKKPLAMTATPSEAVEPEIAASGIAASGIAASGIAEKEIAASDVATQRPLAMTTTPPEAAQAADQPTQMLQPLPLEEAWPVQRQTPQRARPESQAILPGETPPEILGQEEHALVREALREVSPGQPTDSTVEVITPRRPRPAPVLQQGKERQAISPQPPARPSPESGKGEAEKPSRASETVETEIGPLPSDLWELIGESPRPARSPVREASRPVLSRTMQGAEPAVPGEPVPGESPGFLEGEILREVTPELVQRQASEPSSAGGQAGETALSTTAEAEQPAAGQSGAANPPAEMDMDELAVRVYGEVKKRLAVEWERLRRRF